jgi:hypothetical protein
MRAGERPGGTGFARRSAVRRPRATAVPCAFTVIDPVTGLVLANAVAVTGPGRGASAPRYGAGARFWRTTPEPAYGGCELNSVTAGAAPD